MQEIHIYTDISFYDHSKTKEINACGASILKHTGFIEKSANLKSIILFLAENSSYAELLFGAFTIDEAIKHSPNSKIKWFCDLPYVNDFIYNKETSGFDSNSYLSRIASLISSGKLEVKTPHTSSEKNYHNLCHRACSMTRSQIESELNAGKSHTHVRKLLDEYIRRKDIKWNYTPRDLIFSIEK